jgi:RNA 2',3'-cyclic 3'-phosphodiesterase
VSGHRPARRRLFFAIWPDDAERRALASAVDATLAAAGGRAVPLQQLHLTLEFLGSVAAAELPALAALGAAMALPIGQAVVLDRLDWWRRAAMLVAVPSVPALGLLVLQADLRRALSGRGFRVDSRPFRPHVTLARKVAAPPPPRGFTSVTWPLGALTLVESVPSPAGSSYIPLARWPVACARVDFSAH